MLFYSVSKTVYFQGISIPGFLNFHKSIINRNQTFWFFIYRWILHQFEQCCFLLVILRWFWNILILWVHISSISWKHGWVFVIFLNDWAFYYFLLLKSDSQRFIYSKNSFFDLFQSFWFENCLFRTILILEIENPKSRSDLPLIVFQGLGEICYLKVSKTRLALLLTFTGLFQFCPYSPSIVRSFWFEERWWRFFFGRNKVCSMKSSISFSWEKTKSSDLWLFSDVVFSETIWTFRKIQVYYGGADGVASGRSHRTIPLAALQEDIAVRVVFFFGFLRKPPIFLKK